MTGIRTSPSSGVPVPALVLRRHVEAQLGDRLGQIKLQTTKRPERVDQHEREAAPFAGPLNVPGGA